MKNKNKIPINIDFFNKYIMLSLTSNTNNLIDFGCLYYGIKMDLKLK